MKIVATTSLPAVDCPNADRWNATRSRQKGKVALTELVTKFRDKVISPEGAILANAGDKIFLKLLLDHKQGISDQNFYLWIKAKVKAIHHNAVTVDEVVLVNKFEDDRKQKVCDENFDTLKSRFRGSKTITLKKDENWLIVPNGQTSGISSIPFQEHISLELGLEEANSDTQVEEQEPESMDIATVLSVMRENIFLDETKRKHINEIITTLFGDQSFKVASSKQLMLMLQAKMPADKDTEQMLYTINVMQGLMGISLIPNKGSKQFFEAHWKNLDKMKASTFKFAYAALFDKINANRDNGVLTEMFPQAGKVERLAERIHIGLNIIDKELKKLLDAPPTAPDRLAIYEEVIPDEATVSNGTSDEQPQGNNSNPNGDPPPSQGTETASGDNLNPPPENGSATGNEMSISELFKQLTTQNNGIKKI